MQAYFQMLIERFGAAWNRFWYSPSDPLTLSVLRVCVGLLATYTVFTYSFDLTSVFGADGLVPVRMVRSLQEGRLRFSYLEYIHGNSTLWAVHLAGLAIMLLFTAGVFTRVTSVLALVVFLSYIHRAVLLTSQFEPVLAFLLFYLCLGPAGAYLSVDRRLALRRGAGIAPEVSASFAATIAIRLMQVHLTVVYAMMALSKISGMVWWNGTAAWWLMLNSRDTLMDFSGLSDKAIRENTASAGSRLAIYLINAWTHLILAFELSFPILVWNRLARPLVVAAGVLVWGSVAVLTGLLSFALVMIVANLAFLSPNQMRSLLGLLGRRPAASTPATGAATGTQ
ncbi:MAG TPA: hypothetical protein VHY20_07625 [Pirellulales bacterium]|jgi:hypothetical protein|nr:hypothetical protein [Pirellulales bacterium]